MLTHYDILDISNDASPDEIRKAYRVMSKKHHPDMNGNSNSRLYSAVNEAFAVLSEPDKRAEYDRAIQDPSFSSYSMPSTEDSTPPSTGSTHESSEIRQVPVNWANLSWWRDPDDSQVPVKNLVPHRYARLGIVSAYWVAVVLLATISFLSPVQEQWGNVAKLGLGAIGIPAAFLLQRHSYVNGFALSYNALHVLWLSATVWWSSAAGADFMWLIIILSGVTMGLGVLSGLFADKVIGEYVHILPKPRLDRKSILQYSGWGTAGKLDDAVGKYGADNVAKGAAGEQYTATLLHELIARFPGTRVFHGLKFPGSETADVDHALVRGNKVIFIDSKQWSGGEYSWSNNHGFIDQVRSDASYTRQSHFNEAVDAYRWRLPGRMNVCALMLIHGTGVTVSDTAHTQGYVRMAGTQEGMDFLGQQLSDVEEPYHDFRVLNYLYENTKP